MTPQLCDRCRQVFLTQARGVVRNGDLLRQAVDRSLHMAKARRNMLQETPVDDSLIHTLSEVTTLPERLRLRHAVSGSIAGSLHGEDFQSMNADVILLASAADAARIAAQLGPRFYAPEDMLLDVAVRRSFAHVIDNRTGLKVDRSFVGDSPFLRSVLDRRIRSNIGSHPAEFWFVTAEDSILMKLDWRRNSQLVKQWENALSIVRVRGAKMDWAYRHAQAKALGRSDDLTRLRDEARV